jgi:hypothetical protein
MSSSDNSVKLPAFSNAWYNSWLELLFNQKADIFLSLSRRPHFHSRPISTETTEPIVLRITDHVNDTPVLEMAHRTFDVDCHGYSPFRTASALFCWWIISSTIWAFNQGDSPNETTTQHSPTRPGRTQTRVGNHKGPPTTDRNPPYAFIGEHLQWTFGSKLAKLLRLSHDLGRSEMSREMGNVTLKIVEARLRLT